MTKHLIKRALRTRVPYSKFLVQVGELFLRALNDSTFRVEFRLARWLVLLLTIVPIVASSQANRAFAEPDIDLPVYGCDPGIELISIKFENHIPIRIDQDTGPISPQYDAENNNPRVQPNTYLSPYDRTQIYPVCYDRTTNIKAEVTIDAGKNYANATVQLVAVDGGDVPLPPGYSTPRTGQLGELRGSLTCDGSGRCKGMVESSLQASETAPMTMGKYLKVWDWRIDDQYFATTQQRFYIVYGNQQREPMMQPWARLLEIALIGDFGTSPTIEEVLSKIRTNLYFSSWATDRSPPVFLPSLDAVLTYDPISTPWTVSTPRMGFWEDRFPLNALLGAFSSQGDLIMDCRDFGNLATLCARSMGIGEVITIVYRPEGGVAKFLTTPLKPANASGAAEEFEFNFHSVTYLPSSDLIFDASSRTASEGTFLAGYIRSTYEATFLCSNLSFRHLPVEIQLDPPLERVEAHQVFTVSSK